MEQNTDSINNTSLVERLKEFMDLHELALTELMEYINGDNVELDKETLLVQFSKLNMLSSAAMMYAMAQINNLLTFAMFMNKTQTFTTSNSNDVTAEDLGL